ncbi:MAG: exo-rhamnogalacturonan lyase family protein, partial [Planctomycetota bacterium]
MKLTVTEPAGAARKSEPVCGGVPLPWGVYKKDQAFSLHDGGREVPAQVLPLVVDEKGFLRWVLVDAQVDLAAKGRKELTLRAAKGSAKPASALKLAEAGGGVTIDTGKVKLSISKSAPFGLFSKVEAGGKALVSGGEVSYTEGGKTYRASAPKSVEVEYSGPMRATVCVRGGFDGDSKSKLLYIARVTAWAGRSDVHVKYSLSSSNPDHYCYRQIQESAIRMKLAAAPADTRGGADGLSAGGVSV